MKMRKWMRPWVAALAAGGFLAVGPALAQERGSEPRRCEARCEDESKRCREICEKYAGDNDECVQACSEEQKRCTRQCREQARR